MAKRPYSIVCSQKDWERWTAARLTGIGASEISSVLGVNPYRSRLRVWAEKTGRLEGDIEPNEAMEMGNDLEPFVAKKYAQRTGRVIRRSGTLPRSTEHDWAICTPDYWTKDDNGRFTIPVQIKTTAAWNAENWAEGPPPPVWWQVQHEMLVTGAPWASVAVLVGGQRFFWADVERDETALKRIVGEGFHFWGLCLQEVAPEADESSDATNVVLELYPSPDFEIRIIPLPPDAVEWDERLRALKAEKKQLESAIKEIEAQIKFTIGGAEIGVLPNGQEAYSWNLQHREPYSVEASDFRVLRRHKKIPELKQFRTETDEPVTAQ